MNKEYDLIISKEFFHLHNEGIPEDGHFFKHDGNVYMIKNIKSNDNFYFINFDDE